MRLPRTAMTACLALAVLANVATVEPAVAGSPPAHRPTLPPPAQTVLVRGLFTAPPHVVASAAVASRTALPSARRRTATALTVNPSSGPAVRTVTLTATVRPRDRGGAPGHLRGVVVFRDRGARIGRAAVRATGPRTGHATRGHVFAPGRHVLTAWFRPARTRWWYPSRSVPVVADYRAVPGCRPPAPASGAPRSSCRSVGSVRVRVPPGPLMLSTAWARSTVFVVPPRGADRPDLIAPVRHGVLRVTVTDLRLGQPGWSLAVAVNGIRPRVAARSAPRVWLRHVRLVRYPGNALGSPAAPVVVPRAVVLGRREEVIATASRRHSRGTVTVSGLVRLSVPAAAPPGRYRVWLALTLS